MIGDDTSARLPVRFVRSVFEQSGHTIPTRYIAASASVNADKPFSTYDTYARQVASSVVKPRALLITETTGATLRSIRFTHALLAPYCESLDTAIIGARSEPTSDLGDVYCGAVRDESVMHAIWLGFENPTGAVDENAWSGATNNLDKNFNPEQAVAKRADETAFRSLAAYCYSRMPELAIEYMQAK